jgi:transposase
MKNLAKSGWFSMTHAERIEAIKAHPNLSYPKLADKLGVASSSISKFARRNGFVRKNTNLEGGTNLRAEWLCNEASTLYATGQHLDEIARTLDISRSYLDNIITAARRDGDTRFPYRNRQSSKTTNTRADRAVVRGVDYEGAKRAFLREKHPDGTPYTEACVVDAHRGVGAKYRAPVLGIHASTPRAAPALIADKRASA